MSWTYSPGAATSLNQVRLLIGDTLSSDQQLQDDEINALIGGRSSLLGAAADCCRSLAAKYSRSVTQKSVAQSLNLSDLAKQYNAMALQFEAQAAKFGSGMPYAGGISATDKLLQEQNSDRVSPQFTLGMDDDLLPVPPVGTETEDDAAGQGVDNAT